jgi:hypothetical protein
LVSLCCRGTRIDFELPRLQEFGPQPAVEPHESIAARYEDRYSIAGHILLHPRVELIGSHPEIVDGNDLVVDVETGLVCRRPSPQLRHDKPAIVNFRDGCPPVFRCAARAF